MTKQFVQFAAQIALITASVTAILYVLKVPEYYLKLTIAIGVGILALSALFVAISNLGRFSREPKPDDGARERKLHRRARIRHLLRRLDTFLTDLRAPRWRYREATSAPWWLVVGPPGHGKSTLLRAAPGAREHAPLEPDISTREPRFFSADGLAFVELPEDFTDHPGYAQFLARVRRKRLAQPFAGVLVVARLTDATSPADLLAGTRAQVLRICDDLFLRIPVVLALPHLDQLGGFPDFCEGLAPFSRPLGVTLSACDSTTAVAQILRTRLADPLGWVRQRCHSLIARPRPSLEQSSLYSFWQQFSELTERAVAAAVYLAAQPLTGGESLRPRGVYFLSAAATPAHDTWLERLAQRVGGALPAIPSAGLPPPQAFVRAVFTTELLRDSPLATRHHLYRWRRASTQAILATLLAGAAVWSAVSIERHTAAELTRLQATWDAAAAALTARPRATPSNALLELRERVLSWRQDDLPFAWGLSSNDQLRDPSAAVYTHAVCTGVLVPLATLSHKALREFADRFGANTQPSAGEQAIFLDQLHLYTLLSGPDYAHDPWKSENETAWLTRMLASRWADDDVQGSEDARNAVLRTHAELTPPAATAAADLCRASSGALALPFERDLATRVTAILTRTPPEDAVIAGIALAVNNDNLGRAVSLKRDKIDAKTNLEPAYTRLGWQQVREQILAQVTSQSGNLWFLQGKRDLDDRHGFCLKLRDNYVGRYIHAWEEALRDLRVRRSADLTEIRGVLDILTRQKKLAELWREVSDHTQDLPEIHCPRPDEPNSTFRIRHLLGVASAPPRRDDQARGQRDSADVRDTFSSFVAYGIAPELPRSPAKGAGGSAPPEPLALDDYHDRLKTLLKELDKTLANVTESGQAMQNLHEEVLRQRNDIFDRIDNGNFGGWRDDLQAVLRPPLDDLAEHTSITAGKGINRAWCDQVIIPLQQRVLRYYPFNRDNRQQVELKDLTDLFHPDNGDIAKFRNERLSGYLDVSGIDVTARTQAADAQRHLHPHVVDLLDDAHKLGILLLSSGAPSLDLKFQSTCKEDVHLLVLSLGGAAEPYTCGPRGERSLHWPAEKAPASPTAPAPPSGDDKPTGASLIARGPNQTHDLLTGPGVFGFFWMIEDDANVRRIADRHAAEITFRFGKFGPIPLTFTPTLVQGGSLFFGFGESSTFLAPMRTPRFEKPPEQLFTEIPYACPSPS